MGSGKPSFWVDYFYSFATAIVDVKRIVLKCGQDMRNDVVRNSIDQLSATGADTDRADL